MTSVSVLVPCFNGEPTLPDVLDALDRQDRAGLDLEVLLVDDASRDRTVEIAEAFARTRPWVRVLRHETNRGLAAALETGRAAARGTVLVTLHEDIVPRRADWLVRLVQAVSEPGVAVAASNVHQRVDHVPLVDRFLLEDRARPVIGLKAEAYDATKVARVGGFACDLRHAGEDIDLVARLRQTGFEFRFPAGVDADHTMSRRQRGLARLLRKEVQLAEVHPVLWRRHGYCTAAIHGCTLLLVALLLAALPVEAANPPAVWAGAAALLALACVMDFRSRWRFTGLAAASFVLVGGAAAWTLNVEPLPHPATTLLLGVGLTVLGWNLARGAVKAFRMRDPRVLALALPIFLLQDGARGIGFLKGLVGLVRLR